MKTEKEIKKQIKAWEKRPKNEWRFKPELELMKEAATIETLKWVLK